MAGLDGGGDSLELTRLNTLLLKENEALLRSVAQLEAVVEDLKNDLGAAELEIALLESEAAEGRKR